VAVCVLAGLVAACGANESTASSSGDQLVVSAAASLEPAFTDYAERAGIDAKQSFAGSDDLAAQIRQGVKPDVYAAANMSLPDGLHADGLVEKPVVFATNELVLAVPSDSDIDSIDDLTASGTTLAIGDEGVPVGEYTRDVLSRLPKTESDAILANVRSQEPDVAGIVGKLTQGAVDGGFVYITDVVAAGSDLRAIELPKELQPQVAYGAAVVTEANNPEGAQQFIDGLLHGDGAETLKQAGFGPPPQS
jgi:molybdate transport system substrate-binding protein